MCQQKTTLIYLVLLFSSVILVTSDPFNDLLNQFRGKNIEILAPYSSDPAAYLSNGTCTSQQIEIKCFNCTAQLICDGSTSVDNIVPCPDLYPYCDPDGVRCSSEPSLNCTVDSGGPSPMRCSGSGYFPAPDNCSKYYVCNGFGSSPYVYQCPADMVYDASLTRCKPKKHSNKYCSILECATRNPVVVHPVYPQYFGLCDTYNLTLETAVAVLRCPNNFLFNPKTFACEYKCRKIGYFPGSDWNKFILCYRVGLRLKYVEETCPPGFYYDEASSNCVI